MYVERQVDNSRPHEGRVREGNLKAALFIASLAFSFFWLVEFRALDVAVSARAESPNGVALVIGNATYKHAGHLANPKNDAEDVATAFQALGYRVIKGIDLDKRAMERTISEFARALNDASVGVLFYAGHGLQVDGRNYLVPIDARLEDATGVDFELVQLATVQRAMERSVRTNIIFLDACRNNPLARNLARTMGTRSTGAIPGLASTEAGVGTLISFSTQPGNVALDGTGRNSPYSKALAKHLVATRSDLSEVLINVRRDVMAATENRQVPWEHSALTDRLYFNPTMPNANRPAKAPGVSSDSSFQVEMAFWTAVRDSGQVALLESYLSRFPDGRFVEHARKAISDLKQRIPEQNQTALSPTPDAPAKSPQASPTYPFDGTWEAKVSFTVSACASRSGQFFMTISNGVISASARTLGGSVDSSGDIRFERQAKVNAAVRLRFTGTLLSETGTGRVQAVGRTCRGTVVFTRTSGGPLSAATSATSTSTDSERAALPSVPRKRAELLQSELKRVGCYDGMVDGDWGSGSVKAMADFNTHSRMAFHTEEPTDLAIVALQKIFARICPGPASSPTEAARSPQTRSSTSRNSRCRIESREACVARARSLGVQRGSGYCLPANRRRVCR